MTTTLDRTTHLVELQMKLAERMLDCLASRASAEIVSGSTKNALVLRYWHGLLTTAVKSARRAERNVELEWPRSELRELCIAAGDIDATIEVFSQIGVE